jgi:uncharacterized membrane protein
MLTRALLIVAFLIGSYFFIRWLRRSPWSQRIPQPLIVVGIFLILILLMMRGGAGMAIPLLAVLAPLALRWFNTPPPPQSNGAHQKRSTIQTRFLSISFDEATGFMSGLVHEGRFAGCRLQDLQHRAYRVLWQECRIDPQSLAVLEAYLDHQIGCEWREQWGLAGQSRQTQDASAEPPRVMTEAEAYAVLGLPVGASRDAIQAAYRRLMQRLHPDQGGSDYLATYLNRARAVLSKDNGKMI